MEKWKSGEIKTVMSGIVRHALLHELHRSLRLHSCFSRHSCATALKGVAEVLVGFGISPSILGYTYPEPTEMGWDLHGLRVHLEPTNRMF